MNTDQKDGGICVPSTTGVPNLPASPSIPPYKAMPPAKEKPPVPFTATDTVFALLSLVCGYLFVWLVCPFASGFGTTLFAMLFYIMAFAYIRKSSITPPKSSYGVLATALLSSISLSLFSNHIIQFLNLIFLMGCTTYWVACAVFSRFAPSVGTYFVPDLLNQLFQVPFHNFFCAPTVIRGATAHNKKGKFVLSALLGLVVAVPLLAVVVSLLMQADATFESIIQQAMSRIGEHIVLFIFRLLPAFLTGCYLFGLLYGNLKKRRVYSLTTEKIDQIRQNRRKLPAVTVMTVLFLLCGVYMLFFATQAPNLFSAFLNTRPSGVTYAEYARRGFFELCKVAAINFSVLAAVYAFAARLEKGLPTAVRTAIVLLSIETLLLIGTALRKMTMYISQYGLTQKRVYTSWFMLLLFVLFCIILVSQFRRIPVEKCMVLSFVICFLMLCYSNVDGIIVTYNTQRYEAGTLETLDVHSFYDMPYAAAPHAAELYSSVKDEKTKQELKTFLQSESFRHSYSQPFQSMNLQQILAKPYWVDGYPTASN